MLRLLCLFAVLAVCQSDDNAGTTTFTRKRPVEHHVLHNLELHFKDSPSSSTDSRFGAAVQLSFETLDRQFGYTLKLHDTLFKEGATGEAAGGGELRRSLRTYSRELRGGGSVVLTITAPAHEYNHEEPKIFLSVNDVEQDTYFTAQPQDIHEIKNPLWWQQGNSRKLLEASKARGDGKIHVVTMSDGEARAGHCGVTEEDERIAENKLRQEAIRRHKEAGPAGRRLLANIDDSSLDLSRPLDPWSGYTGDCYAGFDVGRELGLGIALDRTMLTALGSQATVEAWAQHVVAVSSVIYWQQMHIVLAISRFFTPAASAGLAWMNCAGSSQNSLSPMLTSFNTWVGTQAKEDHFHLLADCVNPAWNSWVAGVAYLGTACGTSQQSGISLYGDARGGPTQWTFAHEVGHGIGLEHAFQLGQGNTGGIMDYRSVADIPDTAFYKADPRIQFNSFFSKASACAHLQRFVTDTPTCLTALPSTTCGNGAVERDEECDDNSACCSNCKLVGQCSVESACCDGTTCRFRASSTPCQLFDNYWSWCSWGECYDSTPCKTAGSSWTGCDSAHSNSCKQYCKGSGGSCSNFGNKRDGELCDNTSGQQGICSSGTCNTSPVVPSSPRCGDGVVDPGEDCDGGQCCDKDCKNRGSNTFCTIGLGDFGYCQGGTCLAHQNGECETGQFAGGCSHINPGSVTDCYRRCWHSWNGQCQSMQGSSVTAPMTTTLPDGTVCEGGSSLKICSSGSCVAASAGSCAADGSWPSTSKGSSAWIDCVGQIGKQSRFCSGAGAWEAPNTSLCGVAATYCNSNNGWPQTNAGETSTIACATGFTGTRTRACDANGSWQAEDTSSCVAIPTCAADGSWPATEASQVASIACPSPQTGQQTRACDASANWGAVDTSACTTATCTPPNANYIGDGWCDKGAEYNNAVCNWDGGDCCESTCQTGQSNACGSNGYDCKDPAANASPCAADSGYPQTNPGSTASIACGAGMTGMKTRLCDATGAWQAEDTSACTSSVVCAADSGYPETSGGSTASIACGAGFSGMKTRACDAGGNWQAEDTSACTQITCAADGGYPQTNAGTTASIACGAGMSGMKTRACDASGNWQAEDSSACTQITCAADSGYPQTNAGNTASVACGSGQSGMKTRACDINGNWQTPNTSACSQIVCSAADGFPQTNASTTSTIACGSGQTGNKTRPCDASGAWGSIDSSACMCSSSLCPASEVDLVGLEAKVAELQALFA